MKGTQHVRRNNRFVFFPHGRGFGKTLEVDVTNNIKIKLKTFALLFEKIN
jgi:hypothetical protein